MQKRQGDLLILKVAALPAGAKPVKSRVLARGEATGHAHRLDAGKVYRLRRGIDAMFQGRSRPAEPLYFVADRRVTLSHEEHAALVFEPGIYEVRRQREYSPEAHRMVLD